MGGDLDRVRITERVTAPVTTYETRVRRKKDLEFDADAVLGKQAGPREGPKARRSRRGRPAPTGRGQDSRPGDMF